ncbi:hypothetical protein AHF37_10510 [Paragonimus kellicotti]|nr:hypothetical protein AHF37_10510 [Paragonimus kellicotti]
MTKCNALIIFIVLSLYQSVKGSRNITVNSVNPLENSTSVFVKAVAYLNKQPLPWNKKYSNSSSSEFKTLNGSICFTKLGETVRRSHSTS